MRLLHARHDRARPAAAPGEPVAIGRRNPDGNLGQYLPLHRYQNIVKAIQYAADKINGVEFKEAAE